MVTNFNQNFVQSFKFGQLQSNAYVFGTLYLLLGGIWTLKQLRTLLGLDPFTVPTDIAEACVQTCPGKHQILLSWQAPVSNALCTELALALNATIQSPPAMSNALLKHKEHVHYPSRLHATCT